MAKLFSAPHLISRFGALTPGRDFSLYFVGWYAILDTRRSRASGWRLFPPSLMKGGGAMVTYSELFQLLMFLVAFAGLIFQISSKRK